MNADAVVSEASSVLTVTFDRPSKLNAINDAMIEVLSSAAQSLATRDDLRVLVIAANGPYFSAGMDIADATADPTDSFSSPMRFRWRYRKYHDLYDEFEAIEKPIVVAVQGHCLGGGLELAASADFRFAASDATFGLPEVRLGVIAGGGGCTRLTTLIGPHWTKWVAMAGQRLDAQTALRVGLVHDVVAPEHLAARVHAFAHELVALPAEAVAASKLVIGASVDADRTSQRMLEKLANTPLVGGSDHREMGSRFRPPTL